jgi:hypothetical protein
MRFRALPDLSFSRWSDQGEVGMRWQFFGEDETAEGPDEDPEVPFSDSDVAFWASPVGKAARARLRGDRFFQIELDDATLSAYAENSALAHGRRARRTCDLLGQIEELGWHLEHVAWWRVDPNGQVSSDGVVQPTPSADQVRGIYLFHALLEEPVDSPVPTGAHVTGGHAPTHRRDVS